MKAGCSSPASRARKSKVVILPVRTPSKNSTPQYASTLKTLLQEIERTRHEKAKVALKLHDLESEFIALAQNLCREG